MAFYIHGYNFKTPANRKIKWTAKIKGFTVC